MGRKGKTRPCRKPKCKLCKMICDHDEVMVNKYKVRSGGGSCNTYNVVYLFICTLCNQPYTGRTVCRMNIRTNQHRSAFYKVLKFANNCKGVNLSKNPKFSNDADDLYALGMHLVSDHGCTNRSDFDKIYKVMILENASPRTIDIRENIWIHKLKSLRPLGINRANPFSLPLLSLNDFSVK